MNAERFVDDVMRVRITFTERILGTGNADPEVHEKFIASKAPTPEKKKEEVESISPDEEFSKALTVFARMDDKKTPCFYDYQIRGFFKGAWKALRTADADSTAKNYKNYKKAVDEHIFVFPRKIPIKFDGEVTVFERPLRGSTPQGERVTLASSECIPAGATIEFTVKFLKKEYVQPIIDCLDYGEFVGIGQWRNSGCGRILYEILDSEGNVIGGNRNG